MDLERTSVVVRERTTNEAMDLGILMGRHWWRTSAIGILMVGGPLFLVLNSVLWTKPPLALLCMWWLKPLFERIPLAVIGRGFFSEQGGALRFLREIDWRPTGIILDLTLRRFSPYRSYFAPVDQLESLRGGFRRARVAILGRDQRYAAFVVALFGLSVEVCLWAGVYAFVNMIIPEGFDLTVGLPIYEASSSWPQVVSNALFFLAQVMVMPFYVGMGFSLYIKRRIDLEAWDLDLAFRRLRRRLVGHDDLDRRGVA